MRVLIVFRCVCALKPREEEKVRALHHCVYNAHGVYVIQSLAFEGDETLEAKPQVNSLRSRVSRSSGDKREKERF